MNQPRRASYPALDTVRGIVAAEVMLWHSLMLWHWFSMARLPDQWFIQASNALHRGSEIAVTMFFVLSGTVLTLSILSSPRYRRARCSVDMRCGRIFRLFPLVFLVVTVAFVWMYFMRQALGFEEGFLAERSQINRPQSRHLFTNRET